MPISINHCAGNVFLTILCYSGKNVEVRVQANEPNNIIELVKKIGKNINKVTVSFYDSSIYGGGLVSYLSKDSYLNEHYKEIIFYRLGKEIQGADYSEETFKQSLGILTLNTNMRASRQGHITIQSNNELLKNTVDAIAEIINKTIDEFFGRKPSIKTFTNRLNNPPTIRLEK